VFHELLRRGLAWASTRDDTPTTHA
jgi:hypothetical protein